MGAGLGPDKGPAVLESRRPDGRGLRISFLWQEDRYGHEIAYVDDRTVNTLFVTEAESDPGPWPSSPPLQQISWLETVPGQRIALLVGMAGKSHWSFSAETAPEAAGFVLDVACRVQSQPERLGSTYHRCERTFKREASGAICFDGGPFTVTLAAEPVADGPPTEIDSSATRLSIAPSLNRISLPETVRWKYRISLELGG